MPCLSLATELYLYRISHQLSTSDFAKYFGLSQQTISAIELGKRSIPEKVLEGYSNLINVDISILEIRWKTDQLLGRLIDLNIEGISKAVANEILYYMECSRLGDYNGKENINNITFWENYLALSKVILNVYRPEKEEDKLQIGMAWQESFISTFLVILKKEHRIGIRQEKYFGFSTWPPIHFFNEIQKLLKKGIYPSFNKTLLLDLFYILFESFRIGEAEILNLQTNTPLTITKILDIRSWTNEVYTLK